ncbi:hypothetical protein EDF56_10186 [Novosphingobium sp. PhB165]|uniref:hypothetical protein n=1 Tax=Novosphingobium sp. PhB165 TaxID=2485105 RepID=UPI0010F2AC49|nr:hypothetical protein [Novosphingobium sp. PhB165]TCM21422.1 hypothetical protein EDF56_10186 [Novosphingobium sp. PhB165]
MRQVWTAAALTVLLIGSPAAAKQPQRAITDSEPDAIDVAKTPVTDLNLDRIEIPPLLKAAIHKPYDLSGLKTCDQIAAAVQELDTVLGPDIDLPSPGRDIISPGRVAKWAVASFIPFRGLIREISGANAQDQSVLAAARAGIARRAFLKGVGEAKDCKYPASPATPAIIQARAMDTHVRRDRKGANRAANIATATPGPVLPMPSAAEEEYPHATLITVADTSSNRKGNVSMAPVPFTAIPVVQKIP